MEPSRPARLAAIDLGTNSVLLRVAEAVETAGATGHDDYRVLREAREQTRLGHRLDETGRIDPEATRRTLEALARLEATARAHGAGVRAVGTAALREAENGLEFVAAVRERLGLEIEIIGAEREAELALRSVRRRFPDHAGAAAIADIGGGSLEVVLSAAGEVDRVHSMPLGAVRLTERHVRSDPIDEADWRRLTDSIDGVLDEHLGTLPFPTPDLFGSGGTFTAIAALVRAERDEAEEEEGEAPGSGRVFQGYSFGPGDLEAQLRRLRGATLDERRDFAGLPADRADIITAGAAAVARLGRRLGATRIRVNDGGVRDGLLLEMLEEARR